MNSCKEMEIENRAEGYQGVWTLGEMREGKIHHVSYELLAWGRDLQISWVQNLQT
jgi:hypothetical protein